MHCIRLLFSKRKYLDDRKFNVKVKNVLKNFHRIKQSQGTTQFSPHVLLQVKIASMRSLRV